MEASVIIPVWNGASVIADCLESVYRESGDSLLEVICVENASHDDSAVVIAQRFPNTRLLRQPVNLGFAGGVNTGIDAAQGDFFVLLNQDCVVKPGWLRSLVQAMAERPRWAIAGSTLYLPDGSIEHAGAYLQYPSAMGTHIKEITDRAPHTVATVTGAVFAIRRTAWETIGRFDEGYYPAYYEETDYCYRARHHGFEIGYVPGSEIIHLMQSEKHVWYPLRHAINHFHMRYRFVLKHFSEPELEAFFAFEKTALEGDLPVLDILGRLLALRETLRGLAEIMERRQRDLGFPPEATRARLVQSRLAALLDDILDTARRLRLGDMMVYADLPPALVQQTQESGHNQVVRPSAPTTATELNALRRRVADLRQREYDLMSRYYFYPVGRGPVAESLIYRLWRFFVLRPGSALVGRSRRLYDEIESVRLARRDALQALIEYSLRALDTRSTAQGTPQTAPDMEQRIYLLELLLHYEHL